MNLLLLILIALASQGNSIFPQPEFVMEYHPTIVRPGDTFYVMVVAKNPFDKPIFVNDIHDYKNIQFHLKNSGNQMQTLISGKELTSPNQHMPLVFDSGFSFSEIQPGKSSVYFMRTINVPPLVDLNEPFWEKHLSNLRFADEEFTLCVSFKGYFANNHDGVGRNKEPIQITLETPIVMKQRFEKEMALIYKWYKSLFDYLESDEFQEFGVLGTYSGMPKNVVIKNEKFNHWYFFQFGNLYPNTTDVPVTWQDWKQLEDSLTPSTMRDEIRLTRTIIQYCDTEDKAVLKELKEWFNCMNEVQRNVLATALRQMAAFCYTTDSVLRAIDENYVPDPKEQHHVFLCLPQFCEIYKTIREYDVMPIPDSSKQHLRNLGLLE